MSDVQQEVIIYKEGMTSAQRRFEKDLKQRQHDGWRVVNITPTKQAFNRITNLTVIYEKSTVAGETSSPKDPTTGTVLAEVNKATEIAQGNRAAKKQPAQQMPATNPYVMNPYEQSTNNAYASTIQAPDANQSGLPRTDQALPPTISASLPAPTVAEAIYPSDPYTPVPDNIYHTNPYVQAGANNPYASNLSAIGQPPPPLAPRLPYNKTLFLSLIGAMIAAFILPGLFPTGSKAVVIGPSLLIGVILCILIIDIEGYFSLDGLLKWRSMTGKQRIGWGCLFLCMYPFLFIFYFVRVGIRVFKTNDPLFSKHWNAPQSVKQRAKAGVIIGLIIVILFTLMSLASPTTPTAITTLPDLQPAITLIAATSANTFR